MVFNIFYASNKGDLLRMGYLFDKKDYNSKKIFDKEYKNKYCFKNVSDLNLKRNNKFTVLVIGDSFSEQENFGYKNYLGSKKNISVVYLDNYFFNNPISTLYGLNNGNLLDSLDVDYIVLQCIERTFTFRGLNTDTSRVVNMDQLCTAPIKTNYTQKDRFKLFTNNLISFPLTNLQYLYDDNAYNGTVFKVKTTEELFSVNRNELLFYDQDLNSLMMNSDLNYVNGLNKHLNTLSKKMAAREIQLIVLPAPDKYDLYYEFILPKNYPKPLFFDHLRGLKKDYLFLDAKEVLQADIPHTKDLYYYDDTHWTPNASKLIANQLELLIKRDKAN